MSRRPRSLPAPRGLARVAGGGGLVGWLVLATAGGAGGCRHYDYELGAGATGGAPAATGGAAGATATGGAPGALPGLVGWAAVPDCGPLGTVGGEGGPVVVPATVAELREAAAADGPAVIELSGRYEVGTELLDITSDKTLIGVDAAELVGAVRVRDANNVVFRNIRIDGGPTADTTDALEVTGASCVWIDHCEILDGADGNLDIVRGSDLITVSWTQFHYVAKTDDHRFSSLCGNTDTDTPERLNVTFHHNWWGEGVLAQMPRVRHGKVHIFNNYYSATGNEYCIGAGYMARLLVENNVFDGVTDPIRFQADEDPDSGGHTAEIVEQGNDFTTASGETVSAGAAFTPPYAYSLQSALAARESVLAGAGVE